MSIRVRGNRLKQAIRKLDKLPDNIHAHVKKEAVEWAEDTMTESKKQVPVDTGTLRSTGVVVTDEVSGFLRDRVKISLTYGGPAVGYAVIVHEDLRARHDVGNAKYLERPFSERRGKLKSALKKARLMAIDKEF